MRLRQESGEVAPSAWLGGASVTATLGFGSFGIYVWNGELWSLILTVVFGVVSICCFFVAGRQHFINMGRAQGLAGTSPVPADRYRIEPKPSPMKRFAPLSDPEVPYVRALKAGIEKVQNETDRLRPKVFLSIEFTERNQKRIEAIRAACHLGGVDIEMVRSSTGEEVLWREIIERMRQSTDFVAVWTPSPKAPLGSKRPSPWCLWELGVANALGIQARVMIEKGTDVQDYIVIHGGEFYYPFSTPDEFHSNVAKIVELITKRRIDALYPLLLAPEA
jgi:hypothetical protein